MSITNIIIAGVGGQGSLLAAKLLGTLLINQGLDVKVSEVHGMSQRGGSVVTCVRYGDTVHSPLITAGEADYVVSFEPLEAARYADMLKPGGTLITNTRQIDPMPVITGAAVYPEGILDTLRQSGVDVDAFDALALAVQAGSPKAVNLVLLGRLARRLPFAQDAWNTALEQCVPAKFVTLNQTAFALGYGE